MSSIEINDLTQKSQILDLEYSDTENVTGGSLVATGVVVGAGIYASWLAGRYLVNNI